MRQVWYVHGEHDEEYVMPTLFDTKEAAEVYARVLFSEENGAERYSRIGFQNVYTKEDANEQRT
jgi:hypothetical protein